MSCKNSFLAVVLDEASIDALDFIAAALRDDVSALLGLPPGCSFKPIERSFLHMTALFFGEHLCSPQLDSAKLRAALAAEVQAAVGGEPPALTLTFRGFELFPPEKRNLVVATFEAPEPLRRLRDRLLAVCSDGGLGPSAAFKELLGKQDEWLPHVTLGKIGASGDQVGRANAGGAALWALAPRLPLRVLGFKLLGERPWSWPKGDGELALGAEGEGQASEDEALGEAEEGVEPAPPSGGPLDEARRLLGDRGACREAALERLAVCDVDGRGELDWDACLRLCGGLGDWLGVQPPEQAKLKSAFAAALFARGHTTALPRDEVPAFFRSMLRALAERRAAAPAAAAAALLPPAGPGGELTPAALVERWAALPARQEVVEFFGAEERRERTPLRCFSNFYDEEPFDFELPAEFCAPGLALAGAEQRRVRCGFSEKAIMLCKAAIMGDTESYARIAAAEYPAEAKELGRQVEPWDEHLWSRMVCSVAFSVTYAKFQQIPFGRGVLLGTGRALVAEASKSDRVWGIGLPRGHPAARRPGEWRGGNVLGGWALMEVRERLRAEGAV